jgi:hypothetical protein
MKNAYPSEKILGKGIEEKYISVHGVIQLKIELNNIPNNIILSKNKFSDPFISTGTRFVGFTMQI